MGLVDTQLVEQHLRLLVGMGDLDPAHEADRRPVHQSEQEMVARFGQENPGQIRCGLIVEQMWRGKDQV